VKSVENDNVPVLQYINYRNLHLTCIFTTVFTNTSEKTLNQ